MITTEEALKEDWSGLTDAQFNKKLKTIRKDRRKDKRYHNHHSKKLKIGTYAFGCRNHPGIVVAKTIYRRDMYGSDVEIQSLIDGTIESCSIMHCGPHKVSKEYAIEYAEYTKKYGMKMASIKYNPEGFRKWAESYNDPSYTDHYKSEAKSLKDYLGLNDVEFKAFEENNPPAF